MKRQIYLSSSDNSSSSLESRIDRLSTVTRLCMGNRMIKDYAAECNVSLSIVSKILNKSISCIPRKTTLKKLATNPSNGICLEDFYSAAGYSMEKEEKSDKPDQTNVEISPFYKYGLGLDVSMKFLSQNTGYIPKNNSTIIVHSDCFEIRGMSKSCIIGIPAFCEEKNFEPCKGRILELLIRILPQLNENEKNVSFLFITNSAMVFRYLKDFSSVLIKMQNNIKVAVQILYTLNNINIEEFYEKDN